MRSRRIRPMREGAFVSLVAALAPALFFAAAAVADDETPVQVGSKSFPESYLLAELMAQTLEAEGFVVERRFGFGGTLILFRALEAGEVDVYPEYTGTLLRTVLDAPGLDEAGMRAALEARGLDALAGFGFENSYALATPRELAEERGLATISDLADHRDLRLGFSHEFLEREDGWPGLAAHYGLDFAPVGLQHGLAYQALAERRIDVTDAYTTDGELVRYPLVLLEDDRDFFPEYHALPLARADLPPRARAALERLAGTLDARRMQVLNAELGDSAGDFERVAARLLGSDERDAPARAAWDLGAMGARTLTHLQLTGLALLAGCLTAIPLALLAYRYRRIARPVLYVAGLLQTIPSIALLALMIPLLGVGKPPAIAALWLYSLLPMLRNAVTALGSIDPELTEVAAAMGMTRTQQLRHVTVPLALPHVLAGIRVAAVISIGTATLAAFIGAGGLGEPIVTGLALNDTELILAGAVPAALLALLTELVFEGIEALVVAPPLRERARTGA